MPAQSAAAGAGSSTDGKLEDLPETRLNRTSTGDTIEGQIFPTNRIPLLMLQSKESLPHNKYQHAQSRKSHDTTEK